MKRILGNSLALLFLLIFVNTIEASTYKWSLSTNKKDSYVNEAIYLHYSCHFSDSAELYVVEFNPTSNNDNYSLKLLREEAKLVDGKKVNEYELLLVVKEAGPFKLSLNAMMKKTNKDSIENSVLGRDNANYEEFSTAPVELEPISVNVLETTQNLVGEFSLSYSNTPLSVEAYEPFHLTLEVKGYGNFTELDSINYTIKGVKIFSEPASKKVALTKEGESGTWIKKFAFVSENNFTIEPLRVNYLDLKSKEVKELKLDAIRVEVKSPSFTKEELLDEKEKEFSPSYEYIYYVLTFLAG
ncbi:MAG: hypothetical protein U9N39_00975, partial [Campylobacterota bacterium]|nr:hypothetical protein [Campylobacterota bacterium]